LIGFVHKNNQYTNGGTIPTAWLRLSGCDGITNVDGLQRLTSLQSLDLSACAALTNVDFLKDLTNLHHLDLEGTQVEPNAVNRLRKNLPKTSIDYPWRHRLLITITRRHWWPACLVAQHLPALREATALFVRPPANRPAQTIAIPTRHQKPSTVQNPLAPSGFHHSSFCLLPSHFWGAVALIKMSGHPQLKNTPSLPLARRPVRNFEIKPFSALFKLTSLFAYGIMP
jgi:hypothetical protein